jgi:hypothetical protein
MDNNLADINYTLKTVCKTSTTNTNDKCIKIIQTEPQTHTLNASLNSAVASFITNGVAAITLTAYINHLIQYNLVVSAAGSTFTVRIYAIDSNYDEVIENISFAAGDTSKTTVGTYRNINDMEIISGALDATTLTATPTGFASGYGECILFGSLLSKINYRYMCPRGKRAKLSSIDYFRNVNSTPATVLCDLSLQIFLRDALNNVSNPLFQYLQVTSPFTRVYNYNGAYNLEYGDSVIFYRLAATGAVACNLSATFTVYDDGVY